MILRVSQGIPGYSGDSLFNSNPPSPGASPRRCAGWGVFYGGEKGKRQGAGKGITAVNSKWGRLKGYKLWVI